MQKRVTLTAVSDQTLPSKFQEGIRAQSKVFTEVSASPKIELPKFDMAALQKFADTPKVTADLKPEFTKIQPKPSVLDSITLQDFLAAQSSSPTKLERKA